VLAALSVVGGWIQFAGVWTPISDFLATSARPLVEATTRQEIVSSVFAVLFGLVGIWMAWWIYGARRAEAPSLPRLQRLFERKFYFDELYDALFYRPAVWVAEALLQWVERPVIGGSATELALGTRESARFVGRVQTGLLRLYALALASGLAVLVIVFISVR
jgi:NADH-quinone oxidoreductase subunit L